MLELPRGIWNWLARSQRNLARIASALEKIAEEIVRLRRVLQDDQKENQ